MKFDLKCSCGCGHRLRLVDLEDEGRASISVTTPGQRYGVGVVLDKKQVAALVAKLASYSDIRCHTHGVHEFRPKDSK